MLMLFPPSYESENKRWWGQDSTGSLAQRWTSAPVDQKSTLNLNLLIYKSAKQLPYSSRAATPHGVNLSGRLHDSRDSLKPNTFETALEKQLCISKKIVVPVYTNTLEPLKTMQYLCQACCGTVVTLCQKKNTRSCRSLKEALEHRKKEKTVWKNNKVDLPLLPVTLEHQVLEGAR